MPLAGVESLLRVGVVVSPGLRPAPAAARAQVRGGLAELPPHPRMHGDVPGVVAHPVRVQLARGRAADAARTVDQRVTGAPPATPGSLSPSDFDLLRALSSVAWQAWEQERKWQRQEATLCWEVIFGAK